jgi:hypothetical protein
MSNSKKQEIYFLPIFGLRLVEKFNRTIPKAIKEYYRWDNENFGDDWQYLIWILMRVPESHDKPPTYFMDIYDEFKQDLNKDMRNNNKLYGHHESCPEHGLNYDYIRRYWAKHIPKDGYSGNSNYYPEPHLFANEYLKEPLYYHKKHGWGLALTYDEVIYCILKPISERLFGGTDDYKNNITPAITPPRLKPLGRRDLMLRPLLATQGIFCPCRGDLINNNLDLKQRDETKQEIQHLLNERLLFNITDDGFGSLKLINWPYDEPLI